MPATYAPGSTFSRSARTLVLGVGIATLVATSAPRGDVASADAADDFDGDAEIHVFLASGVARELEYGHLTIWFDSFEPDAGELSSPLRLESLDDPSIFVEWSTYPPALDNIHVPCDGDGECALTFRLSGETRGTFTARVFLETRADPSFFCPSPPELPDRPVHIEIVP